MRCWFRRSSTLHNVPQFAEQVDEERGKASIQFVMGYNATPSGQERVIYPDQQMESDKDKTANYLDNVGKQLKKQGINTKSEVRFGDAAEEITKFANEIDADMVALSTHARAGIDRLVFGTVAERVFYQGNTPLSIIRA